MSFIVKNISQINLVQNSSIINIFAYKGNFIFDDNSLNAISILKSILDESAKKYTRMHFDNISVRFDKSWTGEVGEKICEYLIKNIRNINIVNKKKQIINGYDGGDINIIINNEESIINVSSRKLSSYDNVLNVVKKPDEYFVLIPVDQFIQYTQKANLALFIFLKPTNQKTVLIGNKDIEFFTEADFIVPGFLTNNDLLAMKNSGYITVKKKNDIIKGLYNSLRYDVKMYTDNYVIFVNLLKRFSYIEK